MSFMKTLFFSLIALSLTSATQAARFDIINNCQYTVWPTAVPGGGRQLNTGETWSIDMAAGTRSARIWGRTGCNFDGSGRGGCQTGDCGGVISCQLSGQPPFTIAEFSLNGGGNLDNYDISVIDGFNIPMEFSPTSNGCTRRLVCNSPSCPDAYHLPNDVKTFTCPGGTNFKVVFCPNALTFVHGNMHFLCSTCNTL